MTEEEARVWISDRFGEAAAEHLAIFADLLTAENAVQNLISPASIGSIWARHIVDSAQLLNLAPAEWRTWLDIGTGGGFPGMVIALLSEGRTVTMVEPRNKRASFLQSCIESLGLDNARVLACKVETVATPVDVISARAVARPDELLRSATQCATRETTWLFPRGRSAAAHDNSGSMMFHVEHSVTDAASIIHVGKGLPR